MVVRNAIARLAVVALLGTLSAQKAQAADCATGANGATMVTGVGNAPSTSTIPAAEKGKQRLFAERAAFLDALSKLNACLGDKAKTITGWTLSPVRYFDADPIVEVDVTASLDKVPSVTVVGMAVPKTKEGGNVKAARIETTQAAKQLAQRGAKESFRHAFPTVGEGGALSQAVEGTLGGCDTDSVNYWDDGAVSVTLTCGKGSAGAADPKPTGQPAVGKH